MQYSRFTRFPVCDSVCGSILVVVFAVRGLRGELFIYIFYIFLLSAEKRELFVISLWLQNSGRKNMKLGYMSSRFNLIVNVHYYLWSANFPVFRGVIGCVIWLDKRFGFGLVCG